MRQVSTSLRWGLHAGVFSLLVATIAGCGGGGGGGSTTDNGSGGTTTYTIGGTVSGYSGSGLVLQLNGGNDFSVPGNGSFTFTADVANGATYAVTIAAQPAGQHCSVSGGKGTLNGANVTNVAVNCAYRLMGGAVNGKVPTLTGAVTTLSRYVSEWRDGTAGQAKFVNPYNAASDGTFLYVIDQGLVRKVAIATGEVTTLALTEGGVPAQLNYDAAITYLNNALYAAKFDTIRKVDLATGVVSTFTTSSPLIVIDGITTDGTDLYVVQDNRINKIALDGTVTHLAGSGTQQCLDGTGVGASIPQVAGLIYHQGHLYFTHDTNDAVRDFDLTTGAVTTLAKAAGSPCAAASATIASFGIPRGIATDGTALYVIDGGVSSVFRIDLATKAVTVLAGTGIEGAVDGTGSAAGFSGPQGVVYVGGKLLVSDPGNSAIRRVDPATAQVTTLAGIMQGADGVGGLARFSYPGKVATDGTHLYVVDESNSTIRKVVIATGEVTTLAGRVRVNGHQDGVGADALFAAPSGITTDGTWLYVSECGSTIRKIEIATGATTTLAGNPNVSALADGTGTAARFDCPMGITTDGTNLYVADGANHAIRKIVIATGVVTTLAGSLTPASGYLDAPVGTDARFNWPHGITTDGVNLYVVDDGCTLRQIVIATGKVTTLAGQNGVCATADGIGANATFSYPRDITTDGTWLYVLDSVVVRKVEIATGAVTTVAGDPNQGGFADGTGTNAIFSGPSGITTDGESLFVSDGGNDAIRVIK